MSQVFSYGETVEGYKVKVLNENEVRAGAGILFLFAVFSFLNAWLVGYDTYTKIFVPIFLVEFIIRVLINPKYAPSLILGRIITRGQKPIYTGALQKRWAWSLGLILAIILTYMFVLNDITGPFNIILCLFCLMFLFFEAAFGICIGCKIYNLIKKDPLQECPDGKCEIYPVQKIQKINIVQLLVLGLLFVFISNLGSYMKKQYPKKYEVVIKNNTKNDKITDIIKEKNAKVNNKCQAPQWAIDIGHEQKWKLHNGCI